MTAYVMDIDTLENTLIDLEQVYIDNNMLSDYPVEVSDVVAYLDKFMATCFDGPTDDEFLSIVNAIRPLLEEVEKTLRSLNQVVCWGDDELIVINPKNKVVVLIKNKMRPR
jgi:hypothetical protein